MIYCRSQHGIIHNFLLSQPMTLAQNEGQTKGPPVVASHTTNALLLRLPSLCANTDLNHNRDQKFQLLTVLSEILLLLWLPA